MLPEPRLLSDGSMLFGVGSRGRHVGHIKLNWKEGARGFFIAGHQHELETQRASEQLKLDKSKLQLDAADNERTQAAAQRQVDYYIKRISKLDDEISIVKQNNKGNLLTHALIPLSDKKSDTPGISEMVNQYKAKIEEPEL